MVAEGSTSIIAASIPALRAFIVERSRTSSGSSEDSWRQRLLFKAPPKTHITAMDFSDGPSSPEPGSGAAAMAMTRAAPTTRSSGLGPPSVASSDFRRCKTGGAGSSSYSQGFASPDCDDAFGGVEWGDSSRVDLELQLLSPRPVFRKESNSGSSVRMSAPF